jgi:release factor glutamine methyltransferase
MRTVSSIYREYLSRLRVSYDDAEAQKIASIIFDHVLQFSRLDIAVRRTEIIDSNLAKDLDRILDELETGKPVQYVTGHVNFRGLELHVNESVLIPRPETEELIGWVIADQKKPPELIVDFCTGSGCIALALKAAFPEAAVTGTDVSQMALDVARGNAERLSLDVRFIHSDVFDSDPEWPADIVISNPPYVLCSEEHLMDSRVKDFEPRQALFVHDNDPLVFYKRISEWSLRHAAPGAKIYYEINEAMGKEISDLHSLHGFKDVILKKDLKDKDRFLRAIKL